MKFKKNEEEEIPLEWLILFASDLQCSDAIFNLFSIDRNNAILLSVNVV